MSLTKVNGTLAFIVLFAAPAHGNEPVWTLRAQTGPSPRYYHAIVYDSCRGVTVLFGGGSSGSGDDETWEWNGAIWSQQSPATSPSARWAHAMAFDSHRCVTVLFGGNDGGDKGDTWEWDGSTWMKRAQTGPTPRRHHEMVYDTCRKLTVLFGGYSGSPGPNYGDTWEWDGSTWVKQAQTGPSARRHHAIAFDSARCVTVLFGGYDGTHFADTWEWDGSTWMKRAQTGPTLRRHHAMAFDTTRNVVALFGGTDSLVAGVAFRDTWEWNGNTWTLQAACPVSPSARAEPDMAFDSVRGVAVLFGGSDPASNGETWEYGKGQCIPTLSEWGMVAMTLLVLSAGTVVLMRRRRSVEA